MADFISFNQGRALLANSGLPATCTFALSVSACDTLAVTATSSGGFGEITGTGYARLTESEPTATTANPSAVAFSVKSWTTGAATDWPAAVKSCILLDAANLKLICAWNLVTGGTARDMSAASTTESFTPTLNIA